MDEKQKKNKIGNLLSEFRMKEKIEKTGSFSKPKWSLKKRISNNLREDLREGLVDKDMLKLKDNELEMNAILINHM